MAALVAVVLAMATTLFGLAVAMIKGDLWKNAPHWLPYGLFAASGTLYILAATLAALHFRRERGGSLPAALSGLIAGADNRPRFVLEVGGTQPLDGNSDWKFFLTNCSTRTFTYIKLGPFRSEIGAYDIFFREIPVLTPNQKVDVGYEVVPRRHGDIYEGKQATLWDFGMDHAGERGNVFIWYDIPVRYRDAGDTVRDAGILSVCFDLERKILKTEGVEYWNEQKHQKRWI